jgi:glycosyltransferase involved in cell wall biosynthesis
MKKRSLSGNQVQETVVCYTNDIWSSALSEVRLKAPLEAAGFQVVQGNDYENLLIKDLAGVNFVVVQRDFPRYIDHFFNILRQTREHKIPLVYEIDDLLFDLPEDHPDHQGGTFVEGLVPMLTALSKADLVTVSTEPIADFLRPFNPNIRVLPNYLADSFWHLNPPRRTEISQNEVIIGYIGSHTHLPDLNMIMQALVTILDRYGSGIALKFWGGKPPEELLTYSQVEWNPPISSYREFSSSLLNENIDILISPLAPSLFNQCKSPLKFLEYSAMGCPAVYSQGLPYNSVVKHGENGFLADSIDDWIRCLQALIESPTLRFQMAGKAQDTIKKDWLLSHHAKEWADAYHSVVRLQQTVSDDVQEQESVFEKVLQEQISRWDDLQANMAEKEQSVQALSAQVTERQSQLMELERLRLEQVQSLNAQVAEKDKQLAETKRVLDDINKNFISYAFNRSLNRIRRRKSESDKG